MDFTFLSLPAVMICSVVTPSFKIITWDPEDTKNVTTTVLHLPQVCADNDIGRLQCHSNPALNHRRRSSASNPYRSPISFLPSYEDRILAFSSTVLLPVLDDFESDRFFMIFVSVPKLERELGRWTNDPNSRSITWDEWGPDLTRWIPNARPYGWAVCSRGLRFACSHPTDSVQSCRVMVIDFNPANIPEEQDLRHIANVQVLNSLERLDSESSGLATFDDYVYSSLPCVIRTSTERVNNSMGVMMDDEHIVAMQVPMQIGNEVSWSSDYAIAVTDRLLKICKLEVLRMFEKEREENDGDTESEVRKKAKYNIKLE